MRTPLARLLLLAFGLALAMPAPRAAAQNATSAFGQAPGGPGVPERGSALPQPGEAKSTGQSVSNTVAFTNSMEALNDSQRLGRGDILSYRVVEEKRDPIALTVTDSGEVEVPFIGRVGAAGKTCKQLAQSIKPLLEREYFNRATVVVGLSTLSPKPRGKVYLMGQIRNQGAMEIPADEELTVSQAILRAGGIMDFGNRKKVKLTRRGPDGRGVTTVINLVEVLDKGRMDKDPVVQPGDVIEVVAKWINI